MSESSSPNQAKSQERSLELKLHGEECPETGCDHIAQSMNHLVDHITDEHDIYHWVTSGRPINE